MRILIIEDDIDLAKILKKCLESQSFTVDMIHDGKNGSYLARTNEYDVIILDNMLPGKTGAEICNDLRNSGKNTPIIILSSLAETEEKVGLFKAGVDDYMTKPYSFDELVARIHSVLRRGIQYKPSVFSSGKILLDSSSQVVRKNGENIDLTRKEFALLELLLKNTGKVVSRGNIMEHVWDMNFDPLSRTIDTHILNLRKKIENKNGPKIILNISGRGYKISE